MFLISTCFGKNKSVQPLACFRGLIADIFKSPEILSNISRIEVVSSEKPPKPSEFDDLFTLLSKNPQVTELSLKDCVTDMECEKSIKKGIFLSTTLLKVEVNTQKLSKRGLPNILLALTENKSIKTFIAYSGNLSDSRFNFTEENIWDLTTVIALNKTLSLLDLTHCYIPNMLVSNLRSSYLRTNQGGGKTIVFNSHEYLNLKHAKNGTIGKTYYMRLTGEGVDAPSPKNKSRL